MAHLVSITILFLLRGCWAASACSVHHSCHEDVMVDANQELSMLQMKALMLNPEHTRLANAKPIAWVHIPKCGTSFINVLLQHKGICPGWPDDIVVETCAHTSAETKTASFQNEQSVACGIPAIEWLVHSKYDLRGSCPDAFSRSYPDKLTDLGIHQGLYHNYHKNKGHLMTFLRQPEQRLLSIWYAGWGDAQQRAKNVVDYAKHFAGCQVKMLVRGGKPCKHNKLPKLPSADEVKLAKKRLKQGFVFVGLTDQWQLSICMFHNMFGGPCKSSDFTDTRPTSTSNQTQYDIAVLNGFTDIHDGALYAEAEAIFQENKNKYNVNFGACKTCFASMHET